MKFGSHLLVCFVAWVLLAWPMSSHPEVLPRADLLAGAVVAGLVAAVARSDDGASLSSLLDVRRWPWALAFLGVLVLHVVIANLDVARRVLTPALPIRPGIVKIKTGLRSEVGLSILANAITLTPGTLTMDVGREPGVLFVHWIDVMPEDGQAATQRVAGRFEWLIARMIREGDHA